MPSLSDALHKLSLGKHKHSGSTSSGGSTPASPRQSSTTQRQDEVVDVRREPGATVPAINPHRAAPPPPDVEPAPYTIAGSSKDLPPIPRAAERAGGDAAQRVADKPDLPTTNSNVNNPPLASEDAPQLPPLPRVSALEQPFGERDERPDLPTTTSNVNNPPVVTGDRAPLPHVTSVLDAEHGTRTPPAAVSPHVSSVRQPTSGGTPTVPPPELPLDKTASASTTLDAASSRPATSKSASASWDPRYINDHWYSSHSLNVPTAEETAKASAEHLARHLAQMKLPTPTGVPNVILPKLPIGQGGPSLEEQRQAMVLRIAEEEASRPRPVLSEEGRRVFEKAGMTDRLGIKDTIDIRTRWLEPVIQVCPAASDIGTLTLQERVIRKEHTEYTYEIYTEIHKYHV